MAISTNGTVIARLAGGLYNTVMSNATYLEVAAQDPSALANTLYSRDFAKSTDLAVATTLITNLGLSTVAGLDNWVAAQLTAAGTAGKGAKIVSLLNDFAGMTADTTYGTQATAFNAKVDAALAASQKTGAVEGKFATAGVVAVTNATFTLTSSLDTVVGGAGDDTINATAVNPTTGAAATNLTAGDSIDGGAGTDTLNVTMTAANNTSLTGVTVANVEVVNLTGANFQSSGTTSSTLVTATAAKATAAADLAAKQAALVTASLSKNAASAVDVLASTNNIKELAVVSASTTTVATAASQAAAAAAVAALTTETDVVAASVQTTALATGTTYSLAELNAAALAATKAADGTTLITAGNDSVNINNRSAILKTSADAVNLAVKSTAVDLATAIQLKAAADNVAATAGATILTNSALTGTALTTAYTALATTAFTEAQWKAASVAATKSIGGVTLVAADVDNRKTALATDADNLATYESARGNFTLAQLNAAAVAALSSDTGSTLITNNDDSTAIDARAEALNTAATAVVTAATTAVTTATAVDAAAGSALTAATTANTAAAAATVSAAQFVGSTQVWLKGADSNKIAVTGVAATQTIGLDAVTGMDSSVTYAATVTAGSIASNAAAGTLTVTGAALASLAVSGTGSTGLTLVDGSTTDTIKTLSVATSGATVVNVAGATALTTVSSTGVGGLSLNGAGVKLASVTTGEGADSIRITTTTIKDDATTTTVNETVTAAVSTGAGADSVRVATTGAGTSTIATAEGNDTVYITGVSTGASTVDAGAGNDTVALNVGLSTVPSLTIAGGDGTDTIAMAGSSAAFTATQYLQMNSALSGFEGVKFTSAVAGLDSSKLAIGAVTNYTFNDGANVIEKVAAGQNLVLARAAAVTESTTAPMAPTSAATTPSSLTATAVDYKVGTGGTAVSTVYGGALDVTASGKDAIALTLNGSSAKVAVSSLGGLSTSTTAAPVATTVTIGAAASDVQSLEVVLTSARGTTTEAATEYVTTFAAGTIAKTDATTYNQHLNGLSSLKVSGSGVFSISTGTVAKTIAKLTTIDLSGMTAFADLDVLGAQATTTNLSTSAVTLNDLVAETVVLGGGKDTITTGSTVGEIDTISGFQLTAQTTNALAADTARSDAINVPGILTFTKFLNTATTLAGALTAAGANDTANLIFHFGGDTYIYADRATGGGYTAVAGLDDGDFVVKVVGTQDIDLLIGVVG
jgi:hypothetical protein